MYEDVLTPPKWMVKIMEKPMNKRMIWGGFPYFWKHPSGWWQLKHVLFFPLFGEDSHVDYCNAFSKGMKPQTSDGNIPKDIGMEW